MGEQTATDRLRAKLDELGIAWFAVAETATEYAQEGTVYRAYEFCDGLQVVIVTPVAPEQAIAATVGERDYTYDEWRAINEAVGDAMEYAHEHAVMHPDKADPLWNIDEYVNRVLKVAYGPKAATVSE